MSFSIAQKLKKLLKIGAVVDSDDSISYPTVTMKYLGKTKAKAVNFSPFGVWSRPKPGMMSMLFNMNGKESNKFALTNELKNRPVKNLKEGEVVLGNLLSYFHVQEDGSIVLTMPAGKTLTINGNVAIDGTLDTTGKITAQDVIEGTNFDNGSIDFNAHVHAENGGAGPTGPPQ